MNVVYCKSNCEHSKNGICTKAVIEVRVYVGKVTGKRKARGIRCGIGIKQ